MSTAKQKRRGSATLEFTLVGIPLMFVLISTFEMARGMWMYHSLNYAVKEGVRYTIVRGYDNVNANHATYPGVCTAIVGAGSGLVAHDLTLTFHSTTAADYTTTADSCKAGMWPPGGQDANGNPINVDDNPGEPISISASYPFESAIALFWPGAGKGMNFPKFTFIAASKEYMQF